MLLVKSHATSKTPGVAAHTHLPTSTTFHSVGIHHVGPQPTTDAGNYYILIVVDNLLNS